MRLKDKVTLVTGGSSGIGLGISRLAASEGAKVVIAARNHARGEAAAHTLRQSGADALFLAADLRDEIQVMQVVKQIISEFGALHVVINNAGAGAKRSGVTANDEPGVRWSKLVAANLTSTYLVCAHALPELRRTGGGAIVNIASTMGLGGTAHYAPYVASKWAVRGLTRTAALVEELRPIRVNTIHPGVVADSPYWAPKEEARARFAAANPMGRLPTMQQVVDATAFLLENGAMNGDDLFVDCGAHCR